MRPTASRYEQPGVWAAAQVRERIVTGVYAADTVLPPERALARELGIGRFQLRQALAVLAAENLIVRTRRRGTQVLPAAKRRGGGRIGIAHLRVEDWGTSELVLVQEGVTRRLEELGYPYERIAYYSRPRDRFTRETGFSLVRETELADVAGKYAGMLFLEASHPAVVKAVLNLDRRGYPVVVANLERDIPVTATEVDHARVFREAVRLLASLGHERIAFLGRTPAHYFYGRALKGFREGMEAAGLNNDEQLLLGAEATNALEGYLAVRPLLAGPRRPTAVVAARDLFANGVCRAARENGLVLGRDLSVTGYDDLSWPLERPMLTTFREPCLELGRKAVDLLVERLGGTRRESVRLAIEAPLILRRSAGPVPLEEDNRRPGVERLGKGG